MIKTEKEYLQSKRRLEDEVRSIGQHQMKLKENGFSDEQVKLATDPLASFSYQLREEIEEYERLMRGDFDELVNFYGVGKLLVALRIFRGMKQTDLAEKLNVKDSQVSRDENNEYHGASIEKIQRVLDSLGVRLRTVIENPFESKTARVI